MGPLTKLWLHSPRVFTKGVEVATFIGLIMPTLSLTGFLYAWSGPLEELVAFYRDSTRQILLFGALLSRWQIDCVLLASFAFALVNVVYIRKYKIFWVSYAARAFKSLGSDESLPKEWEGPDFKPISLAFSLAVVVLCLGFLGIQFWISWEKSGSIAEVQMAISLGKGVGNWFSQMMSIPEFAALYDFRRFVPGAETNASTVFVILASGLVGLTFFIVCVFIDGAPKKKIVRYTIYSILGLAVLYFMPLILWFLIGAVISLMYVVAGVLMLPAMAIGFIYFPVFLVFFVTSLIIEWRFLVVAFVLVCNLVILDHWWEIVAAVMG